MASIVSPHSINKSQYKALAFLLPSSQKIDLEEYPYLKDYEYVYTPLNSDQEFKPGSIHLFGGKTEKKVIGLFTHRFLGEPTEGDSISQRRTWFTQCISKLARVKGAATILVINPHKTFSISHEQRKHIHDWAKDNKEYAISMSFVSVECDIAVTATQKMKLFDQLYNDSHLRPEIREFIQNKVMRCSCGQNFVSVDCDMKCDECKKGIVTLKELTFRNATFETAVHSIPPEWGWSAFFKEQVKNGNVTKISEAITSSCKVSEVYPELCNVFRAFELCKPQDIKVIIIGQDPYHTPGVATGLAFSVDSCKLQPSLKNIFIELQSDGFSASPKGNLDKWAKQGVFLINTALTVEKGTPNSHKTVYKKFTHDLFTFLSKLPLEIVVVMWGSEAQKFSSIFSRHKKIESAHPSPYSASGFFGTKPFSRVNAYLKELRNTPIDWNLSE